jgi:hypothetical protein
MALSLALFLSLAPQSAGGSSAGPRALGGVDVPLARLPGSATFQSAGVSFLDYDADGWIDLFVNSNAGLWRNEGGLAFARVADLDLFLPPITSRYGASCGDYDEDGLPDIACSPRGACFYLLRNQDGAGSFLEVADDPAILDDRLSCDMFGESFAWCDVDEDGDLDLWLTAYPDDVQAGSGGNHLLVNLGPTGPGGAYHFSQRTLASGMGNPSNVNRPEGAQFTDVDRDGDPDGYANGTLYQNRSAPGAPLFAPLVRIPTGITMQAVLDEGTVFLDYDLDGDPDLVVVYRARNVLWENEGDGTFFDASERLEAPSDGATEGCSAEDWDLDGDLDLSTANVFRRNLLVETGTPNLRLATTAIPDAFLNFCLPAWGDWDLDGDPDCALANFQGRGSFFRNTRYEPDTPTTARTTIRVRPVDDSGTVARGLESEFAASVEARVQGDASGHVRRRFVSAAAGYLSQSEYALTLALPPGPDPAAPADGVRFDLLVDFPSLPQNGILRIDKDVNPILGGLALAGLAGREIRVSRSGLVTIDGVEHAPHALFDLRLSSSGALLLPDMDGPLPEPEVLAGPYAFVGFEFDTLLATGPVRVAELVLDGQLEPVTPARCDANVRLYDVSEVPARLVAAEAFLTSPRNDRSFFAPDWLLKPGRVFRVVCRVRERRASPIVPASGTALVNRGGFAGMAGDPCDDGAALAAPLEPGTAFLELRSRASGS